MAYYGYARVSTQHQKQTSIEVQLEYLRRQAESIGEEFLPRYEKASGKSVEGRQVFSTLLREVKQGDIIGVYDQSRFGRNTEDALTTAKDLYTRGVRIHISGQFYDPSDADSEFMFTIHSALSSRERKITLDKSRASINVQRKNGMKIFRGDLFGWDMKKKGSTTTFTINPTHAHYLRYMYDEFLKGRPILSIAKDLQDVHPDGRILEVTCICRYLQNPLYMGYYFAESGDYKTKGKLTKAGMKKKLIKSKLYPPIIDEETWWKVFESYKHKERAPNDDYSYRFCCYELSGIYRCPVCGAAAAHSFTKSKTGKQLGQVYGLRRHNKDCSWGKTHALRGDAITYATMASLLIALEYGDEVGKFFEAEKAYMKQSEELIEQQIADAEQRKMMAEKTLAKVKKAILSSDGMFDMSDFKDEIAEAKAQIQMTTEELEKLKGTNLGEDLEDYMDEFLTINAEKLRDRLFQSSDTSRRDLYAKLVKEAFFLEGTISLEFNNGKKFIFDFPKQGAKNRPPLRFVMSFRGDTQAMGFMDYNNNRILFDKVEESDSFYQYYNTRLEQIGKTVSEYMETEKGRQ